MTQASESGKERGSFLSPEHTEYAKRMEVEREKAIAKYQEIALLPGGHPDYDVLDYAINELVGLRRYGEMVLNRVKELTDDEPGLRAHAEFIGLNMKEYSARMGCDLIRLRQNLLKAGIKLGKPEHPKT